MKRNMFKINLKRFLKNRILTILLPAFFVLSVGYITYDFILDISADDQMYQFVFPLWDTNLLSIYSCACFAFVSFEFCSRLYTCNLYETVYCTPKKLKPLCLENISVLTLWNLLYCALLLAFNFIAFLSVHSYDKNYFIHIFLNILINFFLINTLAILFGQAVSFLKNKIWSYLSIIIFLIMGSLITHNLASAILDFTNGSISIFPVYNLFAIYTQGLEFAPTTATGFSVLPYRVDLIFFWSFLMLAIITFYLKGKKVGLKPILSLALSLFALFSFITPESRLVLNSDPNGEAMANQYYPAYAYGAQKINEAADFCIENYEMDLKINRKLNAVVTMKPDKTLSSYTFTLYHGYKIKEVTDQNQNKLDFIVDGDFVTVQGSDISSLTIQYSGSGKNFYSNYQGIYLPGDFPYYPIAGKHQICHTGDYFSIVPDNTPYYEIKISSGLPVYSNLGGTSETSFSGATKAPGLFAGAFLAEKEHRGARIVYPYLYGYFETNFSEYADMLLEGKDYKGKTVFVEPNTNGSHIGLRNYDDVIFV